MKCPVCPLENVPAGLKICPSCGTNLLPLYRVGELGNHYFNRALKQASEGRLDEALENASAAVSLDGDCVPARVLLGKILWLKRQPAEAMRNWNKAASLDPENQKLLSILEKANEEASAAQNRKTLIRAALFCSPLVLAAGIFLLSGFMNARVSSLEASLFSCKEEKKSIQPVKIEHVLPDAGDIEAAVQTRISALQQEFSIYRASHSVPDAESEPVRDNLRALEAGRQKDSETISSLLASLGAIDGVITRQEGASGTLVFSRGLFGSGSDKIGQEEELLLFRISGILKSLGSPLTVIVEGHTDDKQVRGTVPRLDNWRLGLDRAGIVIAGLRKNLGSSTIRLLASSSGESDPPFLNDSREGREKNRTVILRLSLSE